MELVVERISDNGKQTLGKATLYDDNNKKLFKFVTLEPSWKNNAIGKSCIPLGKYNVTPRYSAKYKQHFIVEDTEPRSYILIHIGNYRSNSTGCILVGKSFLDINNDGDVDITSSGLTLRKLVKLAPNGFVLNIV